jgi:exonuclease VII small subunit
MKRNDIGILTQIIDSLEEAELKLEEAYEKKDAGEFAKAKKFMIQMERKIMGIIR